jgi:hypothetical protein
MHSCPFSTVDGLLSHPFLSPSYTLLLARSFASRTENLVVAEAMLHDYMRVQRLTSELARQPRPAFTEKHARLLRLQEHHLRLRHRQLAAELKTDK